MNIKEYLASGIVESYVMGLADEEEREEFERLCNLYPQVAEARNSFELTLEKQVMASHKQPPRHVREQLLHKIKTSQPVLPENVVAVQKGYSQKPGKSIGMYQYLVAASIIVVICCGYFLYRLQVQNNNLAQTNKQLLAKFNNTDSTISSLVNETQLKGVKSSAELHLAGISAPVNPQADIYWDSTSAAVYLVIKNLPTLPKNKQYQLWAQIDGKPKSLGVFEAATNKVIFKMNNTKKAGAFAITVEPKSSNTKK